MALQDVEQGVENTLDGVKAEDCAIIVIDELGDLSGSPLEGLLKPPTLKSAEIVRAARKKNIPVIFTNDAHIKGLDRELELWGDHGLAGTPEAQTSPELEQQEGDFLIEKRRYSAFFQTSLRLLLDELGKRTLILCGFDTNICVMHTAADAYFNGFDIVVVSDATATFLIGDQAEGLEYMNRCYAARIVDTNEVLKVLG